MKRKGSGVVVADAGPLIGLTRTGKVELLRCLFGRVLVPPAVESELSIGQSRPGSQTLAAAMECGWLTVSPVAQIPPHLSAVLDRGEAEAIILAKRESVSLLIDESRGRAAARYEGVSVFGTGAVLLRAKEEKFISDVRAELEALRNVGYRISDSLCGEIMKLAGEEDE